MKRTLPFQKSACAALTAAGLIFAVAPTWAQQAAAPAQATAQAAPEETFSSELGHASVDNGAAVYSITATRDFATKEKGGKVRMSVVEKDGAGTMTHLMTINTGKYKTVSQLGAQLADIFRKYLAAEPANQEIGKIGDINHGGEIRFVAESREQFRYDWLVPGEAPHTTKFKRKDIEVFLGILTQSKAAAN